METFVLGKLLIFFCCRAGGSKQSRRADERAYPGSSYLCVLQGGGATTMREYEWKCDSSEDDAVVCLLANKVLAARQVCVLQPAPQLSSLGNAV